MTARDHLQALVDAWSQRVQSGLGSDVRHFHDTMRAVREYLQQPELAELDAERKRADMLWQQLENYRAFKQPEPSSMTEQQGRECADLVNHQVAVAYEAAASLCERDGGDNATYYAGVIREYASEHGHKQPEPDDDVRLRKLARHVTRWDWSDNDEDCVRDVDKLRDYLDTTITKQPELAVPPAELTQEILDEAFSRFLIAGCFQYSRGNTDNARAWFTAGYRAAIQAGERKPQEQRWLDVQPGGVLADETREYLKQPEPADDLKRQRNTLFNLLGEAHDELRQHMALDAVPYALRNLMGRIEAVLRATAAIQAGEHGPQEKPSDRLMATLRQLTTEEIRLANGAWIGNRCKACGKESTTYDSEPPHTESCPVKAGERREP